MKHHNKVYRSINPADDSVSAVIAAIAEAAEGLVNPVVDHYEVVGWEPMTDEQRAKADRRSEQARRAGLARQEKKRRDDIAKAHAVLAKYGEQ